MSLFRGAWVVSAACYGPSRSAGLIVFAVAMLLASRSVHADELLPLQGGSVQFGSAAGSIYYTAEPAGFRVVATVSQDPAYAPVRFVATLQPGQSVVLSIARAAGNTAAEVLIRRIGDRVIFNASPQTIPPTD